MLLGVLVVAAVAPFKAKADADQRVELWKAEAQERILDAREQAEKEVEQSKAEHEETLKEAEVKTADQVIAANS